MTFFFVLDLIKHFDLRDFSMPYKNIKIDIDMTGLTLFGMTEERQTHKLIHHHISLYI